MNAKLSFQILLISASLACVKFAHAQATVTVDGDKTYQTISGWGGNTYGWILNGWNGWSNEQVYEVAFNELRTTHLRLVTEFECWEEQNDDGDPEHFNWAYYQSRFQQSDTKGLLVQSDFKMIAMIVKTFKKKLMLGIWNAPDWMVSDPSKKDHRDLPYRMHAEFAESVAAYLLWAREQHGIAIPEIVLANEPDGTYIEYSPQALRDLIKVVGAKFKREGITTKIVAPDLASPYFDPDLWITTLLNDSIAASYLSAISYHTYYVEGGPDVWNTKFKRIAQLAARKKLPVYFTEIGTSPWEIQNTSWAWAFDCAQMWHNTLTHGNASVSYHWALLGRDSVVNPDATRNPIFYALAQFFHHVPAGAVRIAASSNHRDLLVSAFKHVASNSAQLVLINRAQEELNVTVNLKNLTLTGLKSYRSSSQEKHLSLAEIFPANEQFHFAIPSHSIMTFTGTLGARNDIAPPAPPDSVQVDEN